jgi:alkanesulfonate monooxygenase SsuD/methylene tetrahydromethanopterin reductase-like flavin-dependent oxidoreductase (luciferase family)
VHDTTWFEIHGRPAVFIASSEFADAAAVQAAALGMPDVRRVLVPHPIQDATDDEMRAKADAIVDAVLVALTATPA